VLVLLAFFAAANAASLLNADYPNRIPGQYIVVVRRDVDIDQYVNKVQQQFDLSLNPTNKHLHTYNIGTFKGYSALLSDDMLARVMADPLVEWVEADSVVNITQDESCVEQPSVIWNLDRISERELLLDGWYEYPLTAGEGVTVYVIDTGVYVEHNEFEGRASWGWAMDNVFRDGNGHGTHVAGTVGGRLYGVAKKTTLVGVKVLGAGGSGSWADVIAGIDWVTRNARKPAVANMSLGGGNTPSVVQAVENSIASGVTYAIAAGNSNADACNFSPANAPNCISTGATTSADFRASYSNWGRCVKVNAPGSTVTAAWIGNPNAINTISGTSMAAPHVAGAAALILAANPIFTPAQVGQTIAAAATPDVLQDVRTSPNLLLFTDHCEV